MREIGIAEQQSVAGGIIGGDPGNITCPLQAGTQTFDDGSSITWDDYGNIVSYMDNTGASFSVNSSNAGQMNACGYVLGFAGSLFYGGLGSIAGAAVGGAMGSILGPGGTIAVGNLGRQIGGNFGRDIGSNVGSTIGNFICN